MTFGVQNSEEESHAILDYYVGRGGNFIDTAEMYPAPASDPRWKPGASEEIIGQWLAKKPEMRSKVFIATKVAGFSPSSETAGNRKVTLGTGGGIGENGKPTPAPARLDAASIIEACDASLKRLQTNYIDLYQIHWPDRYAPLFGSLCYNPQKERPDSVPIAEQVAAVKQLIDSGKIRYYGLSNETTFGVCQWVQAADKIGCPRPVSIQNQFSLLYRPFEGELAEACAPSNYNIGLLAWTPLAGGMLTNKYFSEDGKLKDKSTFPEKSRHTMYQNWMVRFLTPNASKACERYAVIAKNAGMSMVALALQFCVSRWFVASTIIGATTIEQLKENMDAFEEAAPRLSDEVLKQIDEVHADCQNPTISIETMPYMLSINA
uniref:NADP-dependent oxidoreductase domain-containing protein n=1 Tax=Hanusia phi TaxID=3032 RepID=A0A7S0HQ62_9CRYP